MMHLKWRIACLATAVAVGVAAPTHAALVDGLLNYWNVNDNLNDSAHGLAGSASTVADNGVFAGTNGTDGIGYAAGLFGSAISQNGAGGGAAGQEDDGFVRVPRSADTLQAADSISISTWVNAAGYETGWQTILAHGEGEQYRIARRDSGNFASYAGGVGDIPTAAGIGPDISAGTGWHHILAISEHGVSARLWVDGGLVATGGAPNLTDNGNSGAPGGATPDLFIGANPQTGAQNREWNGLIDDVATWGRALSDAEIASIYTSGRAGSSLGTLVPEPSSVMLCVVGLLGLLGLGRRQR